MQRRAPGTGTITPKGKGFVAQLWVAGKRVSFGVHATYEDAVKTLDDAVFARYKAKPGSAGCKETFGEFATRVLANREADGIRGVSKEQGAFRLYIEPSPLAKKALVQVTSFDISEFARRMKLRRRRGTREFIKHRTILRVMTIIGAIFTEAMDQQMLPANPFLGLQFKQKKLEKDANVGVFWDVLSAEEQLRFAGCHNIPSWGRDIVRFAWGTGLRQGEQWDLEIRDLHLNGCQGCEKGVASNPHPHLYVRNSKNGRPRVVPLFGHGFLAAMNWLKDLPTFAPENPRKLVFPTARGCHRGAKGPYKTVYENRVEKKVYLLNEWLLLAGVKRHLRWHDLRHTCGSSLVRGVWGWKWSLDEVRDMLGHSSVKVTELYSHLDNAALSAAALATPMLAST